MRLEQRLVIFNTFLLCITYAIYPSFSASTLAWAFQIAAPPPPLKTGVWEPCSDRQVRVISNSTFETLLGQYARVQHFEFYIVLAGHMSEIERRGICASAGCASRRYCSTSRGFCCEQSTSVHASIARGTAFYKKPFPDSARVLLTRTPGQESCLDHHRSRLDAWTYP